MCRLCPEAGGNGDITAAEAADDGSVTVAYLFC